MTFAGNWLYDTFNNPLSYAGHEGNFQAYVNTLTLPPGKTQVAAALRRARPARQRRDVGRRARGGRSHGDQPGGRAGDRRPDAGRDLLDRQLQRRGADGQRLQLRRLHAHEQEPHGARVAQAPVPKAKKAKTTSKYDVVEKTIGQLRADMESGVTTSQEITRGVSRSDRVLRQGSVRIPRVRDRRDRRDGAGQGRRRRAQGGRDGAAARHPDRDQESLRHLRHADDQRQLHVRGIPSGAGRVPGRAGCARPARSSSARRRSRSTRRAATTPTTRGDRSGTSSTRRSRRIASSGGSASAVAASLAAAAMGSQTGDSLYAPASAASLVTLRGTDGLESGTGVMPLVWLTDFGGAMTRSVPDLADMLNVVAGDRSRRSRTTAPGRRAHPRGLALGARPERAAGQADRLHPVGVGRSVRDDRHDRRREGRAAVPRGCRRDDRRDGRDRGRHRHAARAGRTRPATSARRDGCSTSTAIPSW